MAQAKQHLAEHWTVVQGLLGQYELDYELVHHKLVACIPPHHCLASSTTVSSTFVPCP